MDRIHLYCDETGQQTGGRYYVVAGVAITGDRKAVEANLREIETRSGKRLDDWHGTSAKRLRAYLEDALAIERLKNRVFFRVHEKIVPSLYLQCTANTLLAAGARFGPEAERILVPEGVPRKRRIWLEKAVRGSGRHEIWAGHFRKHPAVRLADALAGLIFQARFQPGSKKAFPDLVFDWFVEL